jgi:hypothetical protein
MTASSGMTFSFEMSARRLDVDGQSQPYTNNIIWAAPATGG